MGWEVLYGHKKLKKCMKRSWNFQRGGGSSVREERIFYGIAQFIEIKKKQKTFESSWETINQKALHQYYGSMIIQMSKKALYTALMSKKLHKD